MNDRQITRPGRERPRRLRSTGPVRDLVAETTINADHLIMPHFVLPAETGTAEIASMPGILKTGVEPLVKQVERDLALGIRTVLLFGTPAAGTKDAAASAAVDRDGTVPAAVKELKNEFGGELTVMTDVCLCAYTDHGHCGLVTTDGYVDNDSSLPHLAEMALAHAEAGADFVAPSDMMDGRVQAIRDLLDDTNHERVGIMSYAVKYASAYYGPFRDAADSSPTGGTRESYQMDPRNAREAVREAMIDEAEGADMLMVKPALAYLDVIRRVCEVSQLPLAAYNVSGEYSSVKAAAEKGWIDEARVVRENLLAMRRAGADILITYHARDALSQGWL
jgi:porphobilinogen synthase